MTESPSHRGWIAPVARAALHALAVAILAAGSMAFFASETSWQTLDWALRHAAPLDALLVDLGVHVGLCAIVWAAMVISMSRLSRLARQIRGGEPPHIKLAGAGQPSKRGTVLTETIIVLPVALLLIMGIAQLTLVNIAATLSDLAVIQAARSAFVWAPEAEEGRFNVDRTLVEEKARVQVATIMAPTASANFGTFSTGAHSSYAGTFRKTMGALYGAQLDDGGNDVGSYATAQAELELSGSERATERNMAFNLAFDSKSFEARSARKLYNAWAQTEIELVETQDHVGVKMKYHHLCLMPLVASIFGEHDQVGGEEGYFVTLNRAYSLRKQVKPNAKLPLR